MSNNKPASGQRAAYKLENRMQRNRKLKLERALKRNPENKQIQVALQSISYRRKTPKAPVWDATKRRVAELFKFFAGGKLNMDIFSKNEKVSVPATLMHGSIPKQTSVSMATMFNLGTRVRMKV